MPWKESTVSDERTKFVAALLDGAEMAAACREFGISRKTGYKWWDRYDQEGPEGLADRSRAPHHSPHAVPEETVKRILALRSEYGWGPKKLGKLLAQKHPRVKVPSLSAIAAVLHRHGLTAPRKRRRRTPRYQQPFIGVNTPNSVWTSDFKGHFRTGDGTRCHPLTIADCYSRFVLRCQSLTAETTELVKPVFEAAFREYGLPLAIRTDNGPPFASTGLVGLSRLGVWFIKLGIVPERIEPGHPEQNGRHERMHLTLKEETAAPPKGSMSAQQRAFNKFRHEFNHVRPHEALDLETPASLYEPSPRLMPDKIAPPTYDTSEYEIRKVSSCGVIAFDKRTFFLSGALAGEHVGLRYLGRSVWVVRFAFLDLAIVDIRQVGKHIKAQPLPPELSWDAATRLGIDADEDEE